MSDSPGTPTFSDHRKPLYARYTRQQLLMVGGVVLIAVMVLVVLAKPGAQPQAAVPQPETVVETVTEPAPKSRPVREQLARLLQSAEAKPATDARPTQQQIAEIQEASREAQASAPVDPVEADLKRLRHAVRFGSNAVPPTLPPTVQLTRPVAKGDRDEAPEFEDFVRTAMKEAGYAQAPPQAPVRTQAPPTPEPLQKPAGRLPGTHRLRSGTVIETQLENQVVSQGPVRCLVVEDVYAYDLTLVIPKGSKILGEANVSQEQGEWRATVAFHTVQLPDETDLDIEKFAGLDQAGDLGVNGKVNTHAWARFGAAALTGAISGLGQLVGSIGDNDGVTITTGQAASSTAQATSQILDPYVNRPPTVTVKMAKRIHVNVAKNLDLPEWKGRQ